MPGSRAAHREVEAGSQRRLGTHNGLTPRSIKEPGCRPMTALGGERTWVQQKDQECGAGRRDKRRNLAGGRGVQRPGGRHTALGEEGGSGCDREVRQ